MDNIQIFIISLLVVLIIVCMLLKQKEGWYYTQAYYPMTYTGGYSSTYPSYKELGYSGKGGYQYPGYSPAFGKQRELECLTGCEGNDLYHKMHPKSPSRAACRLMCKLSNAYSDESQSGQ